MLWFLSDLHFCHKNVLGYSKRPFETVEAMNESLIIFINAVVAKSDMVYHLGDFCLGKAEQKLEMFSRLNGQWHLILGNHDSGLENTLLSKFKLGKSKLLSISQMKMIHVDVGTGTKQGIFLCHYAMRSWPEMHYGAWHLYGHSHGGMRDYEITVMHEGKPVQKKLRCMDVGVDAVTPKYYPISLDAVRTAMMAKDEFNKSMMSDL